jgi:putative ABC transport system permease protein
VAFRLVWENVKFRPVRTLLSVLLIAVPVMLILTLVGLSTGFFEDSARRAKGVGADILFRPPGTAFLGSPGGAPLPARIADLLAMQPHVVATTGVAMQLMGGAFDSVTGIDPESFTHLSGPFVFLEGHGLEKPTDILFDEDYAKQRHVHAGQTVNVLNRNWTVAGIVESGKLAHLYVLLPQLQDLMSAPGKVSQIWIKLDNPANTKLVMDQLKAKFKDYPVYSMPEILSYYQVSNIPLLQGFIDAVLGMGLFFGFFVVALSMYMAVLQRTREIGILKSMGASKAFVMGIILSEAFALGLGGTIVGIAFSFVTRWVMHLIMPASLPQAIVVGWWPIGGAVAMGAALLGALYPGMIAVRQDPIEALAYE